LGEAKFRALKCSLFAGIWVILRRNVIYLKSKKPHLDQLFPDMMSKFPDMMSFGEFLVQKAKEKLFAINLMTSYPQTLTLKKLIKVGCFIIKMLHFFFE
jgi:hypothetical protein